MRNVLQTYGNACIATKADLVVAKAAAHRLMLAIVAAEQAHYDNAADEVAQFLAAADHALDKCGDAIEAARIAFDAECQFVATRKAA